MRNREKVLVAAVMLAALAGQLWSELHDAAGRL